ncbi:MAG: chemotaxis protein CheX [Lachnospiraceae bacterium]|nr:chemotaxis protein CheX [Lachnospiraceae bacterium]MBP3611288.1 chemotaxis protein CheX [Lachnospiraceae bacterium]
MAAIKAEHLNPFLMSAKQVLQQVCQLDVQFGPISKDDFFVSGEPLFIMLGITGEITGQVCVVMGAETAKDIASRMMMGMPVEALDDMAKSALSELGNMMMGNAATLLSNNNVLIDITPPTLLVGSAILSSPEMAVIKVPLIYRDYEIQLSFLLKTSK